jgi:hypothetical protein
MTISLHVYLAWRGAAFLGDLVAHSMREAEDIAYERWGIGVFVERSPS